jgi:HAD superfamily hydrolase (TIGR01549 family)
MHIKAVLFDFMGTTAVEKDSSVIHKCFIKAFTENSIKVTDADIMQNRGLDKREMISLVLEKHNSSLKLLPAILNAFNTALKSNLHNFSENNSTRDILRFLKQKNIITGLGTGFPRDIFELIVNHLQWNDIGFDYTGIAEEIGRGRPHPDMIQDMMHKFEINAAVFLKVGDTVADIKEGKNAGVKTAVILAGTQSKEDLIKEQPDYILNGLMELKDIINS